MGRILNRFRERRAERAIDRGNEDRAVRLLNRAGLSASQIDERINPVVTPSTPVNRVAASTITAASAVPALQSQVEQRAQQIAIETIRQQLLQNQQASSGRIFTRFDLASDIIDNQKTIVTNGLFSGNAASLTVAYTSSLQTSSSKTYYYDVWNGTDSLAESQFSVAYGHKLGSGSSAQGTLNDSPTRAIYSQYRLLLLNPEDSTFTFGNGQNSNSIYAINLNRARIKDKLDPGNWQLSLTNLSGSFYANNVHTGSNVKVAGDVTVSLIDDSGQTQQTNLTTAGRVFNIVSGSITSGIYNAANPVYYGLAYPDMGVLVLNANVLDTSMSFNTVTGSNIAGDNAWKLFTSVSGAMSLNSSTNAFQARNEETVTSTHYFVRIKNGEYNFSNNPTFVTGSVGEFAQPTFIGDPKVYITTIGLYNNRQELLAVAKLSKPIQKSFNNEALIKIKLDY
jgi:hypothetical protein